MLILDTDHLVEFDRGSTAGASLRQRLDDAQDVVATTVVSAEEQLRGWLAQIHRQRDPHGQIESYRRLQGRIEFFAAWNVLPWDEPAADIFKQFRRKRIRVGPAKANSCWHDGPEDSQHHAFAECHIAFSKPARF